MGNLQQTCCSKDDAPPNVPNYYKQKVTNNAESHRAMVKDAYAATITGKNNACVTISGVSGLKMGYTSDQLKVANTKNMLGCGNPVSFAGLTPGEVVVDLGCGAGLDCFLAADKVGKKGRVIGVDMTPEMLDAAKNKAMELKMNNVEFRRGEIESLPVDDETADVVISNCVINLSPDKAQVYSDAFRVLRRGGRLCVSDVVATDILPQTLRTAEALAC